MWNFFEQTNTTGGNIILLGMLAALFLQHLTLRVQADERIIGGDIAPEDRYPYMAGLFFTFSLVSPYCGGSLIASDLILTAASCGIPGVVSIGCVDLRDSSCERRFVNEAFIFKDFEAVDTVFFVLVNDYSILMLNESSINVPLAFLPSPDMNFIIGQEFSVLGWGRFNLGYYSFDSAVLMEASIQLVPNADCNEKYRNAADGLDIIEESHICASSPGKGPCSNDDGGPLIIRCDETGEDLQVGIYSWGLSCASPQYPAVFASLPHGIPFVKEIAASQGHSLNLVSNISDFCLVGATRSPTPESDPPTQFPTFPLNWTCPDVYYARADGCDCECGAPDPDCELPFQALYFCPDSTNYQCLNGVCEILENATLFPTFSPAFPSPFPTAPPGWTCFDGYFNTFDGCDCNCGIPDPDCEVQPDNPYNCPPGDFICVNGFCELNGTATSFPSFSPFAPVQFPSHSPSLSPSPKPTAPSGWTCFNGFFDTSDGCDCNCGVSDPDCEVQPDILYNCPPGDFICVGGVCVLEGQSETPNSSPESTPSFSPTGSPIVSLTLLPNSSPSLSPITSLPTTIPSSLPTVRQFFLPTPLPTTSPLMSPIDSPSFKPTNVPSFRPTINPQYSPIEFPSSSPETAASPSAGSVVVPSNVPTFSPSTSPTFMLPTFSPTRAPLELPQNCVDRVFGINNSFK